jgi:hypothetical protein
LSDSSDQLTTERELRWRVPTAGDPALFKVGLAQVGLATIVAALIILLSAPAAWRAMALAGLIPLAIYVAYRRWLTYQRSLGGDDNLRLDQRGLFWRDHAGDERGFEREAVTGYRISQDPDTLRPVPALVLYLAGSFESQPIELYAPATPEAVRRLLEGDWQLAERPTADADESDYDLAIDVYSECHDDFQEWHFEGTASALAELFGAIAEVASFPLPPLGAKPLGRVLLLRRRDASRVTVQHDRQSRIGHEKIIATAETLFELSRMGLAHLGEQPQSGTELKFDLPLGRGNVWTFYLHLK